MYWQALRARSTLLLFGTLALIGLIALPWLSLENSLAEKRAAVEHQVVLQAASRASSYATQLEDLTDRMTQVAELITHQWQRSPRSLNLSDNLAGLLSGKRMLYVVIIDENAQVVTASFTPKAAAIPPLDFFQALRANCCEGWLVSPPSYATLVGQQVVRFSRRLNRPDGSFGGVLMFAALPNFLESFQEDAAMAPGDFVSLRLIDGPVLMTRHHRAAAGKAIDLPAFAMNADQGVMRMSADEFSDGVPRHVGWYKHPQLPIVAFAGVSGADAQAELASIAVNYRIIAALATFALLAVGTAIVVGVASSGARRIEQEEVRRTYRLATDAANEGYYILRPLRASSGQVIDVQIEDCNEYGATMLGLTRDSVIGARAVRLLAPVLLTSLLEACERALRFGVIEDEYRVPQGAGLQASWIYRRLMRSGSGIALTLRDISALKAHQEELNRLANNDALTGLPNRHWLMHQLPLAVDRAQRSHAQLALLFIDLDNFKRVNDTLGHDRGDALLVEAAARLRQSVRASDQVARLGGDEFTVVLEQGVTPAMVAQVAQKILRALCEPFAALQPSALKVTASIGASVFPLDGKTPEILLKNADMAMYAAKAAGRAQFQRYEQHMADALMTQVSSEEALRNALARNELSLHYLPRFHPRSGRLQGLEALVRWQHPRRGLLLAADFVPMASDVGLASTLDDQVMRMLVAQLAEWRDQHRIEVPVSFNVSSARLRSGQFAASLRALLDSHAIDPKWLQVEIAESALTDRHGVIANEIDALRKLGVGIAVDDFGTGQSALAQLLHLKFDVLKIDRDLTASLTSESDAKTLYAAIVSMAKAMQMRVVAEGVETTEQLALLQSIGCDEVQGFLIGQPVAADAVPAMVRHGHNELVNALARAAVDALPVETS